MQGTHMLLEAKHWLQHQYPFWNRTAGRDHIWLVSHDEGSCWVPVELRRSIILSHWGRKVLPSICVLPFDEGQSCLGDGCQLTRGSGFNNTVLWSGPEITARDQTDKP